MVSPYSQLTSRYHEAYTTEMRAQAGRSRRSQRRPVTFRARVGRGLIALGERLADHPPLDKAA